MISRLQQQKQMAQVSLSRQGTNRQVKGTCKPVPSKEYNRQVKGICKPVLSPEYKRQIKGTCEPVQSTEYNEGTIPSDTSKRFFSSPSREGDM